jgi:hypothetical protein
MIYTPLLFTKKPRRGGRKSASEPARLRAHNKDRRSAFKHDGQSLTGGDQSEEKRRYSLPSNGLYQKRTRETGVTHMSIHIHGRPCRLSFSPTHVVAGADIRNRSIVTILAGNTQVLVHT